MHIPIFQYGPWRRKYISPVAITVGVALLMVITLLNESGNMKTRRHGKMAPQRPDMELREWKLTDNQAPRFQLYWDAENFQLVTKYLDSNHQTRDKAKQVTSEKVQLQQQQQQHQHGQKL